MSALFFTENKLFHCCFAKVRSYLSLKHLVKNLKLRTSYLEANTFKDSFIYQERLEGK